MVMSSHRIPRTLGLRRAGICSNGGSRRETAELLSGKLGRKYSMATKPRPKTSRAKLGEDHNLVVMRNTILKKPDAFGSNYAGLPRKKSIVKPALPYRFGLMLISVHDD